MSTSDLYILNGKSTTHLAKFQNGWGSGPAVWDYLGEKYIPEKPVHCMELDHLKKVWALASDDRLEDHERLVLMMTFDKSYVPLKSLEFAGQCCIRFGQESEDGERVNHWRDIGAALQEAAKMKHNRHARGVVLSCTSVSDCWGWPSKEYLEEAWSISEETEAV